MISFYQKVTDQILLQLQNGTLPWVKPWKATAGRNTPCNAITNRPYSGVNTLLLWQCAAHGFSTPRFLTKKQIQAAGGRYRNGQNPFKIYFVKQMEKRVPDENMDDTLKRYTILRDYSVWNVDQCDGLPDEIVYGKPHKILNHDERLELADEFVQQSGVHLRSGSGEAYYSPGPDFISIPDWESFHSKDAYYNTLFHELTHATGHKQRLDRDLKGRFGDAAYAAEELVAELGAAFLCAEFGIDNAPRSASYIQSWIKLLTKDNRAIFTAASKASKAAEWLRQKALTETSPSVVPSLPTCGSIQPTHTASVIQV